MWDFCVFQWKSDKIKRWHKTYFGTHLIFVLLVSVNDAGNSCLVFHTKPATMAISRQSNQHCKQKPNAESMPEISPKPRIDNPDCTGDRLSVALPYRRRG